MEILDNFEYNFLKKKLGRKPNELEQYIVSAEWSEHCSYKSSKKYLRSLPTSGKNVVVGPGMDAGVLDVGDGYVITIHIESHNHPSAVEPYGGAATGVGGVLRDILSMGTRPIALYNALRFGPINLHEKSNISKNKWLLKNVVKGIADYGNCMGVPTVGGEVEFDRSFDNYCLVDVACIGYGKLSGIIKNTAAIGDIIILAGNNTGKDGIHGASFASKNLEEDNRSAIQIPDPFLEKLLLEATLEAVNENCIKSIKDLGGGGLACCLSETADSLKKGFAIELTNILLKENEMTDHQIMISESQERMLYIVDTMKEKLFTSILDKYNVPYSVIGKVTDDKNLTINKYGECVANMPAQVVAHAPLLNRKIKRPSYLMDIANKFSEPPIPTNLQFLINKMISNPSICSKNWIYQQYDYEVGIRTIHKPGYSDASVLKLDNNKYLAFKLDGNSKHCFLDPYKGTMGCLSESIRNIVCIGASPIGIVDHLQFGNPENEEIFWGFDQTIKALKDFCEYMGLPVVGGKVSLYNESNLGAIKPSPVIGAIGLVSNKSMIKDPVFKNSESIFIVGFTWDELGGSEFYEYCLNIVGGKVPNVNLRKQKKIINIVRELIRKNLINGLHDCSKGGLLISLLEMAICSKLGFVVDIESVPTNCGRIDYLLFSESHNRFLFSTSKEDEVIKILEKKQIEYAKIGIVSNNGYCIINHNNKLVYKGDLAQISKKYNTALVNIIGSN